MFGISQSFFRCSISATFIIPACSRLLYLHYIAYNLYDEQAEDKVLTRGMTAQITGTKLKLGGDKSGIYFAPVDNEQRLVKDSRLWVQADHITRNMPKTVEFFVPETLESGTSWRIVLETSLATNGVPMKSTVQIVSDVVQIQ